MCGGGRYDNLVGMFLGQNVPACGFSLGRENINLSLLIAPKNRRMLARQDLKDFRDTFLIAALPPLDETHKLL